MDTTERPRAQLTGWRDDIAEHLPHLSRPLSRTLALWTYAATLTEHIGLTTCVAFLAETLGASEAALRQRLRELYRPATLKQGPGRTEFDVTLSFGPLLAWVLKLLRPPEIVLALDPTLCRDRLAVLVVAIVIHGCAIPVAWKAVVANEAGPWMPHWQPMLARLQSAVPPHMRVVVAADRGLQSTPVYNAIVALGWHPMFRLVRNGSFRARGQSVWTKLTALPLCPGEYLVLQGHLFATRPHACTLVAVWRKDFEAPWLLMTDLKPAQCARAFYGLRCWIEHGFKCLKSGGLRCERMRITDPARADRVWLVLAVSLLWTHVVGAEPVTGECLSEGVRRSLSVHRRGWIRVLATLIRSGRLRLPRRVCVAPARIPTLSEIARPPT